MLLLSRQSAVPIGFSPLTSITKPLVAALFCFMVADCGTNTLRVCTAVIFSVERKHSAQRIHSASSIAVQWTDVVCTVNFLTIMI